MKNMKFNYYVLSIMAVLSFTTFQSCTSDEGGANELEDLLNNLEEVKEEEKEPQVGGEVIIFPGEETGPSLACTNEGTNANRTTGADISGSVNTGTIDDRSCYADYKEIVFEGTTYGVYNITDGSNHMDAPNTLQPRIERSLARANKTGVGTFVKFTGTVVILEAGDSATDSRDGTYIMQTKGKHTGGGGSADPAICLYLAKPKYGLNSKGESVQVSFDIFREQINFRGGSGGDGRDVVFLTNVKKGVPTKIELEVGFRQDPTDATKKIHYSDAIIGDKAFNWNIPEPERGTQSGIRYGAYRVWGGRAQIRWANTTYQKVEKD